MNSFIDQPYQTDVPDSRTRQPYQTDQTMFVVIGWNNEWNQYDLDIF